MCGIAGFVRGAGVAHPDDGRILRQMAHLIRRRGPDGEGVFAGPGVGLAHRRLAVIDLSDAASQPMTSADRRYVITYNGEIYNHVEVRRELEAAGARFSTSSDTEVILSAFAKWGEEALARLNGMFAFAIWDNLERRLFLARDRIGKKPLHYAQIGGDFLFASEIKSMCAWPAFRRTPNYLAIHHYLSFQYVPAPLTAFDGVFKLDPGSLAWLRPGSAPQIRQYWRLPAPQSGGARSAADLAGEARSLLDKAVRRRLVSDVPVGAFLSGGIDSSMTTALMAMAHETPVKTFTIGFNEAAYDERRFARMVAARYGADHHEEVVNEAAADILPDLVWHYGEPFADSSAIPTYFLARLARRHVTVALSGDGGDEFFMGYGRYEACLGLEHSPRVPRFARDAARLASKAWPRSLAPGRYAAAARNRLLRISQPPSARYEPMITYFQNADKEDGYAARMRAHLGANSVGMLDPYFDASEGFAAGAAFADIHTYLPGDILTKVDIATMAHGLEARAPFLDVELMEWAARAPSGAKIVNGVLKSILKDAARDLLPAEVIDRPKMGFGVPIDLWFKDGFDELAADVLLDGRLEARGIFAGPFVERMIDDHRSGRRANHYRLWALVMLELWFRMWIDQNPLATAQAGSPDQFGASGTREH